MVFEADTFVRRNTEDRARQTCPPGIVIGSSHAFPGGLGVWAQRDINEGTIFGPFEGDLVDTNDLRNLILAFQSGNAWEIYTDGKLSYCIDGSDEKKSNWLRYVKFARSKEESNVVAYEQLGKVYHCTTQLIFGGEEFLVYPETKLYATHPKIWMQTSKILVEVKCTRTAPENILLCNKCEKVFFNVEAFNRHLPCNLQTQTDETSCPNPGRFMLSRSIAPNAPFLVSASGSMVFTNYDASNWPWRKYLYDERGSKTPKSELPFCPDEPSSSSLNQEVSTESDKKPFVCKTCEKQFSLKKSFRLHKRTHVGQTHTCGHCNNEYPQLSQLKRHVRMVHHKRYICSVCGAKYGQSSDLKSHMTKHSDVRAHKCRYCGKGLKRADDLKRHERRHTEGQS